MDLNFTDMSLNYLCPKYNHCTCLATELLGIIRAYIVCRRLRVNISYVICM